jgi:hypothetical protein
LEKVYQSTPMCTFEMLLEIIKDYGLPDYDITVLKKILVHEYKELVKKYGMKKVIEKVWKDQGKDAFANEIKENKVSIETIIMMDTYYVTNLDILLLTRILKLPILLISGTDLYELNGWKLKESGAKREKDLTKQSKKFKKMWVTQRDKVYQYYYVIKQPGYKKNETPGYSMITQNGIRLKTTDFSELLLQSLNVYKERPTFEQYMEQYERIHSTKYKTDVSDKPKKKKKKKTMTSKVKQMAVFDE